jgi:Ca2+-binding RTX toxin-like protein
VIDGEGADFVVGDSGMFLAGDVAQDGGNDRVFGGSGDDILLGEHSPFDGEGAGDAGNDKLVAGDGDDDLVGDSRDDVGPTLSGDGHDNCRGDGGTDTATLCEAVFGVP